VIDGASRGILSMPTRATDGEISVVVSDSYLFDAGWLFFAAFSVAILVVSVAAFGSDLFPSGAHPSHPATVSPNDRGGGTTRPNRT
jgi:hypothetical protein